MTSDMAPKGAYTAFPEYQHKAKSKRNAIKKYAKKMKKCLLNVGNKILDGLGAIGHFYATSEQKWQCEYAPLEHLPSQPTAWESIDAADKARKLESFLNSQRKSRWNQKLHYRGKVSPAHYTATSSTNARPLSNYTEIPQKPQAPSTIPSVPEQLLSQSTQRPQHIQSSAKPCRPVRQGSAHLQKPIMQPRVSSYILPSQRPGFYPSKRGMHALQRQPRVRSEDAPHIVPEIFPPTNISNDVKTKKFTRKGREAIIIPVEEEKLEQNQGRRKHGRNKQGKIDGIENPHARLSTVAEEKSYHSQPKSLCELSRPRKISDASIRRIRRGDLFRDRSSDGWMEEELSPYWQARIAQYNGAKNMESTPGRDCDGFEADGELCLRHESCAREAMALSHD